MNLERHSLRLGRRPALIVVDVIKGFTDPGCALGTDCPEVVEANRKLVEAFHDCGQLVVFTTVVYHSQNQARVFRERLPALDSLQADSVWVELDARLDRRAGDLLVEKQWASAFFATELQAELQQADIDSLVVTGLTTSGCVRATAVDGLQYDYPVLIPREAVGDRNIKAHEANLADLHAKYVDVVSLAEVLSQLTPVE